MTVSPFGLRMDPDLHEQVKRDAATNNRSMNAEIVARLEASGETLRDRFAMAALPIMAGRSWDHIATAEGKPQAWASTAYAVADAMIAERSK